MKQYILVGYCNKNPNAQLAFHLSVENSQVVCDYLQTKWENEKPCGLHYARSVAEVYQSRVHDEICFTFREANFSLSMNPLRYTGQFVTGLSAHESGMSGSLNEECVRMFLQNYQR